MLWHRYPGSAQWIIHTPNLVASTLLCLLGLLDIDYGQTWIDLQGNLEGDSLIYTLSVNNLPSVIVAVVFVANYGGTKLLMHCLHKRRKDIYEGDAAELSLWI